MKFFAWINEQQQGPFDEETIQRMVSEEKITRETLLCLEGGDSGWVPAKELLLLNSASEGNRRQSPVEKKLESFPNNQVDDGSRLKVRLVSGLELRIKAIRLYDETVLAEIASKRSKAFKDLKGVSTGIGAIGSIDWVLTATAVIGAVEGALSAASASSGRSLLGEVLAMEQKLRSEGVFIFVGRIENIETPIPGLWRAPYIGEGRVKTGKNFWGDDRFETSEIQSAFIYSGEEFFEIQTDEGNHCAVRWSAIESYTFQSPATNH